MLTIAPTRAGKGVGTILPNLLLADRPVIVIDPKGENYRVAARARNRFGPVWALDPFGGPATKALPTTRWIFWTPGASALWKMPPP